jgi:hypothetical protein
MEVFNRIMIVILILGAFDAIFLHPDKVMTLLFTIMAQLIYMENKLFYGRK